MTLTARWVTQKGKHTIDNRDCYGMAERGGDCLYIIADGSSSSPRGGELANALVTAVTDEFKTCQKALGQDALKHHIMQAHAILKSAFPADAASYLIAAYNSCGQLHTLHAGDCRLGRVQNRNRINWLSPVHTLATALRPLTEEALKAHPKRHILTRCFRGKRLAQSEYHSYSLYSEDELVIATDGFWAEASPSNQLTMLKGGSVSGKTFRDDASCLNLKRHL
jgi:serine/threonine protein phosphatase PrpC